MPIVSIEFNLPEEKEEYEAAMNGASFHCVLSELDSHLRNEIKYMNHSESKEKIYQEIRDKLNQFATHYGVDI